MASENESLISGRLSTAGRMVSRIFTRSVFLAQPGNAASFKLRARRTRLDMTMRSCGPCRWAVSAGGERKVWRSRVLTLVGQIFYRGGALGRLLDFVAQLGGFLEVFRFDGLLQFLLQRFQAVGVFRGGAQMF